MRPHSAPANEESLSLLTTAQRQIHRRLCLVGLGPAAFYLDACRLMVTEPAFAATTHLVAHLLREIESGLRAGLSAVADRPEASPKAKRAGENNHLQSIQAVLRGLEIPETDPAAQAWLRLAGKENTYALAARAHRDNLASPRSLDDMFRSFWAEMERMLDTVTQRFEARYLAVFNTLDQLVAKPIPSATDIKQLQQQIPHNDLVLGYFFDRLNHTGWLEPLSAAGFFASPPPPQADQEQGTVAFPGWSASRYLSRMAPAAPSIVVDIALAIPDTANVQIHRDIAQIAVALPVDLAVRLIPNILTWIAAPYVSLDPLALASLVSRLATHGSVDEALELLAALLAILPDPGTTEKAQAAMPLWSLPPQSRFDVWYYRQILDRIVPTLLPLAWEKVLTLLCDLLEAAITYSRYDTGGNQRDSSAMWRPAIEDHEQNREGGIDEISSLLTSALRDAAVALMPLYGSTVLTMIESRPYTVFRRIGLHLRRTWPDVDPHGTAQRMIDPAIFDESDLHHEYFHLLRERYAHLPLAAQQAYLALVTQNEDLAVWSKSEIQDAEDAHGVEQQRFLRHRQYWKLWPIQNDLDQRWRQHFDALQAEFGPLDHPDFCFYMWTGEIEPPVGPPLPPNLEEMPITELAAWLQTLAGADDTAHVIPTGLVGELTRLVVAQPQHFSDGAEHFQSVHLFYRTALLRGFHEAIKQSIPVTWSPVLALCASVVVATADPNDQHAPARDRSTTRWVRRDVLDLVTIGLHTGVGEIPFTLRQHVWRVLEPLTEDPDPEAADEAKETSGQDLANRSINSVRGKALHTVMRYALWIKRHTQSLHAELERASVSFVTMPEVRSVLDRHLDPHHDSSLIIRSVYGQWMPWLVLLDRSWVEHHLETLFPQDEHSAAFWSAVWEAYIVYCSPYNDALDVLRDEYSRAIAQLDALPPSRRRSPHPQQHLARHLMTFYWRGGLTIDDPLIADFFRVASDDLRSYALTYLARNLTKSENVAEHLERLQRLWLWRINVADEDKATSFAAELGAFGWWFSSGVFDDTWVIAQLEAVIVHGARFEPPHALAEVVGRLALAAPHMPRETIRCFNLMIDQLSAASLAIRWVEPASLLLSQVLKSDDQVVRQQARALINQLSARGDLRFRHLLDDHANP